MLKNSKSLFIFVILFILLSNVSVASQSNLDMERVFTSGLISSLYGAALIGGANTIVILMSDNTKANIYRIKYGFAVGTILGLLYGTIMGIQGLPLIPTFDSTSPQQQKGSTSFLTQSLLVSLGNLQVIQEHNHFSISTKLLKLTF